MASVFGIYKVTGIKITGDKKVFIGFEEGSDETSHLLDISAPADSHLSKIPFRVYWEYFYRTKEMYWNILEDE